MKKINLIIAFCMLLATISVAQSKRFTEQYFDKLNNTHDVISLSKWGPYSKKYAGISHIPKLQEGLRFDVTMIPGFYRNRVMVPNVLFESGYFPWHISTDMKSITYRYELEWKDKVYVDATYTVLDTNSVLVEMRCVNNTNLPQVLQLNLLSNINYPDNYPVIKSIFSNNVTWKNALNYEELTFATSRYDDNLVYNGWLRGEERGNTYIDGRCLGNKFGSEIGDQVNYIFDVKYAQGAVALYYKAPKNQNSTIRLNGLINKKIELKGTGEFEIISIPFSISKIGKYGLTIKSEDTIPVLLNGFFTGPQNEIRDVEIVEQKQSIYPTIFPGSEKSCILKYPDVNIFYGMAWDFSPSVIREILDDELDVIFRKYVHEHNYKVFNGDSAGHYTNAFMRPLFVDPDSEETILAIISTGKKEEVERTLGDFQSSPQAFIDRKPQNINNFSNILSEGEKYVFSQKMMQAALLQNIVYPIYTQNQYIRHFTPGKWWNSLYTWDSGFEALGMTEIDMVKAIEILNAYTTDENSQSAFIHHGSPVPVQMYAFYDIWNKTQSVEMLQYFYPRLKKYYEFLSGKTEGSTTAKFTSDLLKTWDYFYNSGGWDDYPPQKAVRDQGLEKTVSPVITTAHCIRVAKILAQVADQLGLKKEISEYKKDIERFTFALQEIAWDEESKYFSYVVHNTQGKPIDILRYQKSGQNYNMGLDGAYPLFSGICTKEQEKVFLEKIFSEEHMWTKAGICVVDKEAEYYRNDGYWNGAVWMPHQWFMWKTMLDLGQTDLAFKIANTALELWKKETDETYFTYEHFIADIARGAGWHQFGALSASVINWFASYYKPGTVTTGFETWISEQHFEPDHSGYSAKISFDKLTDVHERSIIVCLNPKYSYNIKINNKPVNFFTRLEGLLEISLPATNKDCELTIKKIEE